MRLTHRVKRIERAVAPTGGCRVCHGKGPMPPVLVWRQDEGEPEPQPPLCSACGLRPQGSLKIIVLGDPGESSHAV